MEKLLEEMTGGKEEGPELRAPFRLPVGGHYDALVDLALPHLRHMDPERIRLVKMALQRLQLIQQEGVVLMMPEMRIGR